MNAKKIAALLLALIMVFSLFACAKNAEPKESAEEEAKTEETAATPAEEASAIPAYLHPDQAPLVDEPITLRMAVFCHDATTDPEKTYNFRFIEEILGINIELEYFYGSTRDESVALMMADGDLPDVMIGLGFTSSEIANYGESQGLFLDIAPYINAENAPNLTSFYAEYPQYLDELTTSTGHVYSLGYVSVPENGVDSYRMYYNYDLLEKMGYTTIPETLDEFVQMLRDMKAYGEENGINIVPMGGNYARYNFLYFFLNALGYNHSGDYSNYNTRETDIMLRDGKIVLPCYDSEVFTTYLETLHTLYEEGLMEQEFYTLDKDTTKAHLTSGMYGVFCEVPGLYGGDEFGSEWYGGYPLTSEFNDTPFWPNYTGQKIGEYTISAETEYPELCVALADYYYGDNRKLAQFGPSVNDTDILLGTCGWYYNKDTNDMSWADYEANAEKYEAVNYYRYENITLWCNESFGLLFQSDITTDENGNSYATQYTTDATDIMEIAKLRKEYATFNDQFKSAQVLTWGQYMTDEYSPLIFYFDEATNARVLELQTLIKEYAAQEIAKFVIGERDLSEVDDFYAELANLGADEYVQYYTDYYAAAK